MPRSATKPAKHAAIQPQKLMQAARRAYETAHAPYSEFYVGAAVLSDSGKVYTGCNVENASYGLTICAERTAITTAVAAEGSDMRIRAVAVANAQGVSCSPCGACRQFIYEFGPHALILFEFDGKLQQKPITDLLPYGFRFTRKGE
jgi:cytidine deaminase